MHNSGASCRKNASACFDVMTANSELAVDSPPSTRIARGGEGSGAGAGAGGSAASAEAAVPAESPPPPTPPRRFAGGEEKMNLMVRSASSRVSNHETTGQTAMKRANRKTLWQ